MELVSREVELSRSLLDRALRSLGDSEENLRALPQLERLLGDHIDELKRVLGDKVAEPQETGAVRFPFRMNPETKLARIGERKVPLSNREYAVLELLWEEMPSPVSRSMLLDRLFGDNGGQNTNTADWYIFQVRQKLKNASCDDATIRTVRGRGWVLELKDANEAVTSVLPSPKAFRRA